MRRPKLRQNDCVRESELQDEVVPFRMRQLDPVHEANWQMVTSPETLASFFISSNHHAFINLLGFVLNAQRIGQENEVQKLTAANRGHTRI